MRLRNFWNSFEKFSENYCSLENLCFTRFSVEADIDKESSISINRNPETNNIDIDDIPFDKEKPMMKAFGEFLNDELEITNKSSDDSSSELDAK